MGKFYNCLQTELKANWIIEIFVWICFYNTWVLQFLLRGVREIAKASNSNLSRNLSL